MTWRVGPYAYTYYTQQYYNSSPQEQDATRVHEGVHRNDPNQQTAAFWNSRQHEIAAYTREINYTLEQIALRQREIQELMNERCPPDRDRIWQLRQEILNYQRSLDNAREQLNDLLR